MAGIIEAKDGKLYRYFEGQTTCIEPWGQNALRVRSVMMGYDMNDADYALSEEVPAQYRAAGAAAAGNCEIKTWFEEQTVVSNFPGERLIKVPCGSISNGKIRAEITAGGKIVFYETKTGKLLLEEFARNRLDGHSKDLSALEIVGREFMPHRGGDYQLTARFEPNPSERIYGMGQYQQPYLNLKGCTLELAQRNSQASVPFMLSTQGYGFLWNNPAVGKVTFARNLTEWVAYSTKKLDYWICAGDTPAEIEEQYAAVTGTVPMMPEYAMGFWQCKLRYATQEQLLEVAREYKRRGLPLDVIVCDFFHWEHQGDWNFDPTYWPDPEGMIAELKSMGIELMVSIWPTVENASVNFKELNERGYLIRTERGLQYGMDFMAPTIHFDATNPDARKFVWNVAKKNYFDRGVKLFWLDEAEPEYKIYDFDHFRYYAGSNAQIGNMYPVMYAKTFFDGLREQGIDKALNLLRCAWAGSQKYGALVWSGDIGTTFESMRNQIAAGLNMGLAGITWWTTDIGGFHGGNANDEAYREVFARWFEWGTFCPVMRVHGDREPRQEPVGTTGGAMCCSGGPNEVYSYGERVYEICKKYMNYRVQLKPYIAQIMEEAHQKGTPVIRPMFYDFPADQATYDYEDQHMFGPSLLIAPVYQADQTHKQVYLPQGSKWRDIHSGTVYDGGQVVTIETPLEITPVFARDGFDLI
ncbi:MAG TPA: glycoside hydrolase family 31 protein [Candidatus Anaerobiospirillum stercoravium]|nr:glycoside hydrolase family 31 protein [Candidatus Anaerobiospirillum stercoravium]